MSAGWTPLVPKCTEKLEDGRAEREFNGRAPAWLEQSPGFTTHHCKGNEPNLEPELLAGRHGAGL